MMKDEQTDSVGVVTFSKTICITSVDVPYARINPSQIAIRCMRCKDIYAIPVTERQIVALETAEHVSNIIQRVCPNLKPSLAEMLISTLCGVCWDEIHDVEHIPEDEDEDAAEELEIEEDMILRLKQIALEERRVREDLIASFDAYEASYHQMTEDERVVRSIHIRRLKKREKELVEEREYVKGEQDYLREDQES